MANMLLGLDGIGKIRIQRPVVRTRPRLDGKMDASAYLTQGRCVCPASLPKGRSLLGYPNDRPYNDAVFSCTWRARAGRGCVVTAWEMAAMHRAAPVTLNARERRSADGQE